MFNAVATAAACAISAATWAQRTSAGIQLRTEAEIIKPAEGEAARARLAAADHVVAGDRVLYTVEVHNVSGGPLHAVVFANPLPAGMKYLAGTATGPGAEITFSVDNAQSFAPAAQLRVKLASGAQRAATAEDYTHIRWALKTTLCTACVAYARFCATLR